MQIKEQGEMTATVAAVDDTQTIAINAAKLRALCDEDHDIGYQIMRLIAKALSQRLVASRLQVLDMFGDASSYNQNTPEGASE